MYRLPSVLLCPAVLFQLAIQGLPIDTEEVCCLFLLTFGQLQSQQGFPVRHYDETKAAELFPHDVLRERAGLNFALLYIQQEECQVNLTRLLGALALATGGSLLLSEPLIGPEFFYELLGTSLASLWLACVVAIALGACAVVLGRREEQEFHSSNYTAGDDPHN